ncbi:MAG: D-tyrosyl-tRNA(Tyr) deacylase [Candidatus Krumholzibacteriota bacterium]|nr:D-tyrosyl-tRNA(Tyr) deacylase [Candidatus Krumholzibacteriota bacterium]
MRVVIQRVQEASVEVEGKIIASIDRGILVLAAFKTGDTGEELDWMARKCLELRIFEDEQGKMNRSVMEEQGEVLVVSQFTLFGDCRKGRRPAYTRSAPAAEARMLYRNFVELLSRYYPRVAEGEFGAMMSVRLLNDGPVTLILDRQTSSL